jgi:hypothetical protein
MEGTPQPLRLDRAFVRKLLHQPAMIASPGQPCRSLGKAEKCVPCPACEVTRPPFSQHAALAAVRHAWNQGLGSTTSHA